MAYKRMTWEAKLKKTHNFPKILKLNPKFPCGKTLMKLGAKQGDTVVLVDAMEVSDIMKSVPKGKLMTLKEVCAKIAKKHKVKWACTLVTGIHVMIAANAAYEMKSKVPYWRVLKMEGELNEKYPKGLNAQKKLLEKEGHKVIRKGKRMFVADYEKKLKH